MANKMKKPAGWNSTKQKKRRAKLKDLMEIFHRGKYGDYDDAYAEFEAKWLGTVDGEPPTDEYLVEQACINRDEWDADIKLIPRYASCAGDETYGMIELFDDLKEALSHQAGIPNHGEYLNVPSGIYDLDTGEQIQTVNVVLTVDSFNALCGIVAMSEGTDVLDGGEAVNWQGILCDWDELRATFPLENFKQWAMDNDVENGHGYDPGFGWSICFFVGADQCVWTARRLGDNGDI
jgi:hypothetical protein